MPRATCNADRSESGPYLLKTATTTKKTDLMNSFSYQAAIFDLDGTLLDSIGDLTACMNTTLRAMGYPEHPVTAYRTFIGDGASVLVERALPESARTPEIIQACLTLFREHYAQGWNIHSHLYPGIADMLDTLVARGVRLAILSNKPHAFTVQCADHYLAQWPFEAVRGEQTGTPKKPDPAGALHITQAMSLDPPQFIFLGDSGVDMSTARAAGLFPIGVTWGYRDRAELRQAGAKRIIDAPRQLLE